MFPACAAFKMHLKFFRHCVLDFIGHSELGIEQDHAAVQRAQGHINMLTADGLLKPRIDRTFAFEKFTDAHRHMETCPDRGRVALTLE